MLAIPTFLVFGLSQASDMMNAILEGYPKSKKEFLVRTRTSEERLLCLRAQINYPWCPHRMKLGWRPMKTVRWLFPARKRTRTFCPSFVLVDVHLLLGFGFKTRPLVKPLLFHEDFNSPLCSFFLCLWRIIGMFSFCRCTVPHSCCSLNPGRPVCPFFLLLQ